MSCAALVAVVTGCAIFAPYLRLITDLNENDLPDDLAAKIANHHYLDARDALLMAPEIRTPNAVRAIPDHIIDALLLRDGFLTSAAAPTCRSLSRLPASSRPE